MAEKKKYLDYDGLSRYKKLSTVEVDNKIAQVIGGIGLSITDDGNGNVVITTDTGTLLDGDGVSY